MGYRRDIFLSSSAGSCSRLCTGGSSPSCIPAERRERHTTTPVLCRRHTRHGAALLRCIYRRLHHHTGKRQTHLRSCRRCGATSPLVSHIPVGSYIRHSASLKCMRCPSIAKIYQKEISRLGMSCLRHAWVLE